MRRVIAPVDLGGSEVRCTLRPPLRPRPSAELVAALVAHYRAERCGPEDAFEVGFYAGGVPDPALVAAAAPWPLRLSCSPADLHPADLDRLIPAGLQTVELDALTLDGGVLRDLQRGYTAGRVEAMVPSLQRRGLQVGLTLSPGLPGGSHRASLDDVARIIALKPAFVRLIPALVWEGSPLAELVQAGRYRPMRLGEAVTTLVPMLDALDAAGVPVARVGLQAGQDLPGRVLAGPAHPNLRGLVDGRRFRRKMAEALAGVPPGSAATLRVNPRDLGAAHGANHEHTRAVRVALGLSALDLVADEAVARGAIAAG